MRTACIAIAVLAASAAACTPQRLAPRSLPAEAAAPAPTVRTPSHLPGPTELGAFWKPWFDSPYEYMFTSSGGRGWEEAPAAASEGRVFGGGINGFYTYGGFDDCLRAWLGDGAIADTIEYGALSAMAGRPFRTGQIGEGWDRSFGTYDPAVIEWALKTLVPHPDQPLAGATFQDAYDRTFFRVVRLHALAYAELRNGHNLEREAKAYLKAMTDEPGFYGVDWLDARYAGELDHAYPLPRDYTMMTGSMAMGFWLRRHVDGTEDVLTQSLGVVLRVYDPTFVQRHPEVMKHFGGTASGVGGTR
ncbi:MAG: hypothetical protein GY898_17625 [Proteobacteria bacterium]|nr:hypothetical protein [Pseudomonadota bacterium]